MSKQTNINDSKPSSEECHNAAVRAILHVIDEALEEGSPLSRLEFSTALDMLVQHGNLRKWYKDKLETYNKGRLSELADRLVIQINHSRYNNNSLDGLLKHGSACIKKHYLLKMGLVKNDEDELSADHRADETQISANDSTVLDRAHHGFCT